MYGADCFIVLKDQFPIDKPGYVYSFTCVNRNRSGSDTDSPVTVRLVKFEGVKGGIIHLLAAEDTDSVSMRMKVAPSLKNLGERTGATTHILAFRPISTVHN